MAKGRNRVYRWLGGSLAALGLMVIGGWGWGGGFRSVEVVEAEVPGDWVLGLDEVGPYEAMREPFLRAGSLMDSLQVATEDGVAWYFDDPTKTAPEDCRGFYGRVLQPGAEAGWESGQPGPEGLRAMQLPAGKALVVDWELRGYLGYIVGPIRLYPMLTEAMAARGAVPVAVYERYATDGRSVRYVMVYGATSQGESNVTSAAQ